GDEFLERGEEHAGLAKVELHALLDRLRGTVLAQDRFRKEREARISLSVLPRPDMERSLESLAASPHDDRDVPAALLEKRLRNLREVRTDVEPVDARHLVAVAEPGFRGGAVGPDR